MSFGNASAIAAIFFDVGGVLLTNAWDHAQRQRVTEDFGLDWREFEASHEAAVADFETGRIGIEEYLNRTVFYVARDFTREAFVHAMQAQSQPFPEALEYVSELARSRRFFLASLNNESRELNRYRIEQYGLRGIFSAFFSSCYLGLRKPDEGIYRLALDITQRRPDECLFVDDRAENVETGRKLGMRVVQYTGVADLRQAIG